MWMPRPWLECLRLLFATGETICFYAAVAVLPLADAVTYYLAGPIYVTLIAALFLGERVGWRRWTAIGAGLFGVLLILKPEGGFFDVKLLLAVFGCFLFAFYVIATRLVSRDDSSTTSFFYTGIAGAAVMTLVGPFYWTSMALWDWGWMALLCLTGISSHYFLIRAYDILDAAAVQPLTYLQLVYASIMGVVVFGETLSTNTIVGSIIVVAAGIFTIWREHVVSRRTLRAER
jgi:drug/metabolite transporter (DMT)-like permease